MFSFHRFWRNVAALFVVSCLLTVLVFTGCKTDPDEGFGNEIADLIGTWMSEYDDGYIITAAKLTYDDGGYGYGYSGPIRDVTNFNSASGVIFFEFDEGEHQGKILGVYYENLEKGVSIEMGTASNADYSFPVQNTLAAAKQAFTMGNKGTYISYMGAYTKQQ